MCCFYICIHVLGTAPAVAVK